ncbi:M23 family metallopeptidase [Aurantiacibacter sp. MUD61]|uniref:M23 family metallopeptidase n=1 Tax=Aurantiacibacter sp. MUD61 TaxID=3009083 RepID=UPI0022F03FB2|nr:peptidoglycan DD-metalloendopeptidase family protein [Aurantiacibacter sp. MUD61]
MLIGFAWLALIVAIVALPAIWLALRPARSKWVALAVVFYTLMASIAALYLVPWYHYSYYVLPVLLLLALTASLIAILRHRGSTWVRPGAIGVILSIVLLLGGAYFAFTNVRAWSAAQPPEQVVDMQFPLEAGTYAVTRGGSAAPLQAGHARNPSQHYAVDIVALNSGMFQWQDYLRSEDFTRSEIWDRTVVAPCSGTAIWVRDGLVDSAENDEERPAGNVVGLDCDGITVNLAHMRQGSVLIEEGDQVEAGQPLGRIGMSGRTRGPHLHIHAERGPLKYDESDNTPVAISFDGGFPLTGQIFISDQDGE